MTKTYAQTGLNFQGVARTSNNIILASQDINIKLSILKGSAIGTAEYIEIRKVTTNAQGLFTAVIGDTGAISTLGNFNTINWKLSPKFLKIEMDASAGNNFITMGTTQFQYVAYAQFAKSVDAENIVGILPVSKGGTGLSTIAELKSALALDKINNTTDAEKPISTKTQAALDLISVTATDTARLFKRIDSKADSVDVSMMTKTLGTKLNAADTIKFTKRAYTDSSLLTKLKIVDTAAMLSSRIAKDTLNLSKRIDSKADTVDVILITKTLGTKLNIADTSAMLSSRIGRDTLSLSNRINLKGNAADITSGLALKENATNKSTASDLGGVSPSDVLFPTQKAVKAYVAANAGSGGVADGGITNLKLADGAVSYAKFQNIPTYTILGNTRSSTTSVQAIATTGLDNVVLSSSPTITSPTLITPNIGAATALSINNVTINGFNFKSDVPSLTITGTTTLQGNNTGDHAINSKYEGLLTNGIVDLTTDQAIDGKKTFLNNITMANLLGVGSITPTTINFANGSKIGDIQNIHEDNPDSDGSIDLYAPDGAKWVQLNYDDINYIGLGYNRAFIEVGGKYWKFKATGTTDLPGDLNFTENHAINFTSTGTSTQTTNTSITSTGPLFKIQSREALESELDEDIDYGIELNYADRNFLELREYMYFLNQDNDVINENYWSAATFGYDNFNFLISNNLSQYIWQFKNDGLTVLPGNLEVAGTLKLGTILFPNVSGTSGDVLTADADGNAVWQAPTATSVSDNIDANTLSGTTLKSTITGSSLTSVGTLANLTVTDAIVGSITGNAATATSASTATTAGNITATSNNTLTTLSSLTGIGILNSATINGKLIVGATSEVSVSAVLEASSTTQGFLPPRMTIAQRSVIASPAQGLMIYCTNCGTYGEPQYYNGAAWLNFVGNASAKAIPIVTPNVGIYTYTGSAQGPSEASNTGTGTTYTYSYSGTVSTTYSSSTTKPTEAGDYTVIASVSADGNYEAASSRATAFRILNILSVGYDYQGGKIAYILVDGDPGYDATTTHGLIAATEDQSTGIQWMNGSNSNYTTTGVTGTDIGLGLSNTNTIITSQGSISTSYAAGLARAYTGGGFIDWHLPSINELSKLYLNRVSIGGFESRINPNYWSSTEYDQFFSFYYNFYDGNSSPDVKNNSYRVRAVRSF